MYKMTNLIDFICIAYYCIGITSILLCLLFEHKFSQCYFLTNHGKTLKTSNYQMRIHKSNFWHFYALALITFPFVLNRITIINVVLFLHLLRRLIENFFLFEYSARSYMHLAHYLVGLTYYPILFVGIRDVNGNWNYLFASLFLALAIVQFKCHWLIAKFKRKSLHNLFVPNEGLFRFVWCPHYLAEVGMYACFATNTKLQLNFLFTLLNLSVSAYKTKRWIESMHPKQPKKPAIIPFIL